MGRKPRYDEAMPHSHPIRMSEEQYQRFLRANDGAERIRKFIDSWDMAESPEQLLIEANEAEREAQELLAEAQDKRARHKMLTTARDSKDDDIKEAYDRLGIGHRERERQITWLEGVWGKTTLEAQEWLGQYGPGPEEGEDD